MFKLLKKPKVHLDVDKDLDAIFHFLKEYPKDIKKLANLLLEFKRLRNEEKQLRSENKDIKKNVSEQVKVFDEILKVYEYFQLDCDINGERVKMIANSIEKQAKSSDIPVRFIKKIEKSERWNFDW